MLPKWIKSLESDDIGFIKNFVLCSGSIKEMSKLYGVSYPTMRSRLDELIRKIEIADDSRIDDYEALVKKLALDSRIDIPTARILLDAYRQTKEGGA